MSMTHISRRDALRLAAALAVAVIPIPAAARQAGADWRVPSDDEIRGLIAARNAPRPGQGIVIGILGPDGERIIAGGTGDGAGLDSRTVFEISNPQPAWRTIRQWLEEMQLIAAA
jgi:hypothetical protein